MCALPVLVVWGGTNSGRKYTIPAGRTDIGRDPGNELVIEDRLVSPEHARVKAGRDGHWILDSNSANGTYLNGRRVDGVGVKLQHFDRITLGKPDAPVHLVFLDSRETTAVHTKPTRVGP